MTTYGVGVQNRYSAFLDDDDSFDPVQPKGSKKAERADSNNTRQNRGIAVTSARSQSISTKKVATTKSTTHGPPYATTNPTLGQRGGQPGGESGSRRADAQRHRSGPSPPRPLNSFNPPSRKLTASSNGGRYANPNKQDNTANRVASSTNEYDRSARDNDSKDGNTRHDLVESQGNRCAQQNKENNNLDPQQAGTGRIARGTNVGHTGAANTYYHPPGGNRRQLYHDDKRVVDLQSYTNTSFAGLEEGEKRRRQQKRLLDLKHKDPEKREARRQHQLASLTSEQSNGPAEQVAHNAKFSKTRRQYGAEGNRFREEGHRASRNAGSNFTSRGRTKPDDQTNERRQQQSGGAKSGRNGHSDGPQRNRDGFESGPRAGRAAALDDQGRFLKDNRQKPIPNFSDKLDFPSLAS